MPKVFDKATVIPELLARIEAGDAVDNICRADDMPTSGQFRAWVRDDPDLAARYQAAKEARADVVFEQILDIADQPIMDEIDGLVESGATPEQISMRAMMQRRAQRIDARKWMLGKMSKRYADKTVHSNDPDSPMPAPSFTITPIQSGTFLGDADDA